MIFSSSVTLDCYSKYIPAWVKTFVLVYFIYGGPNDAVDSKIVDPINDVLYTKKLNLTEVGLSGCEAPRFTWVLSTDFNPVDIFACMQLVLTRRVAKYPSSKTEEYPSDIP